MANVTLDINLNSIDDYRKFLRIKSLPVRRFVGRTAIFPEEYLELINSDPTSEKPKVKLQPKVIENDEPNLFSNVYKSSSRTPEENQVYMRAYYAANKHRWKKRTPEEAAKRNAERRERYRTDEEFRAEIKAKVRESRKRNPQTRVAHNLRRYGLTIADYKRILAEQNGGCAICGRTDRDGAKKRLFVDHCHATNRVRGLLCSNCNFGIGKFFDNPERLERAAAYLRRVQREETESSDIEEPSIN